MKNKINNKTRKPMSPEARARISEGMRKKAELKRIQMGLEPSSVITGESRREKPLELIKMKDQYFDPILFQPMKTGKPIDKLFSTDGGIPRATNFMLIGDPGIGKSTVSLDILSDLNKAGHKTLFLSAEMSRIDLYQYVQRYPKFGDVDILFLGEYLDDNPKLILEELLNRGYDTVLIDSFTEVMEAIKECNGMSSLGAEKFIIDLMVKHNAGENKEKRYTSFLAIAQMTKGGTFVGSNKLKHLTSGMCEIRFDPNGAPFIFFSKNRRGPVNKKMYFSLKESGDVHYDDRRFALDQESKEFLDEEKKRLEEEEDAFDTLFGTGSLDAPENDGTDYIRR
jgi:predicted ATP-dependent serine protease